MIDYSFQIFCIVYFPWIEDFVYVLALFLFAFGKANCRSWSHFFISRSVWNVRHSSSMNVQQQRPHYFGSNWFVKKNNVWTKRLHAMPLGQPPWQMPRATHYIITIVLGWSSTIVDTKFYRENIVLLFLYQAVYFSARGVLIYKLGIPDQTQLFHQLICV